MAERPVGEELERARLNAKLWQEEAREYHRVALRLQGRLDGWTEEQREAIQALVEEEHLFDLRWDTGGEVRLWLNMNDTFWWGTADGEEIEAREAPEVWALAQEFGGDGVTAWVARRRDDEPLDAIRQRERYQAARTRLEKVQQAQQKEE